MACNNCIAYVVTVYMLLMVVLVCMLLGLKFGVSGSGASGRALEEGAAPAGGWAGWPTSDLLTLLENFCLYTTQTLITLLYGLYRRLTWFNIIIFLLKYLPTGLYFNLLKNMYTTSREKIQQKQIEIEDIQLQIQIVDTKLLVRESEFTERTEQLSRWADRLRAVRARVRALVAADDALRFTLQHASAAAAAPHPRHDGDQEDPLHRFSAEEEREIILSLLKELIVGDQYAGAEKEPAERGEPAAGADDASVYSSLSDGDSKPECHVKIIKVTNVYKVACLKHFIKQKRMRRATQQAILKKKIEGIKKLLESWQKSLNAVIYSKMSLDPIPIDMASQEAMGDYSKPNLREFSDSDSELKTSWTDICYDEYNFNCSQNNYYNVEQRGEAADPQDSWQAAGAAGRPGAGCVRAPCECGAGGPLCMLPEETSSQVAIEEIDQDCRDDVPI